MVWNVWLNAVTDEALQEMLDKVMEIHSEYVTPRPVLVKNPQDRDSLAAQSLVNPVLNGYLLIDHRELPSLAPKSINDALVGRFSLPSLVHTGYDDIWHMGPYHLYYFEGILPEYWPASKGMQALLARFIPQSRPKPE